MKVFVDIPECDDGSTTPTGWKLLRQFNSKADAVEWIRKFIGSCDDDGNICLLTIKDE